MRSKKTRLVGKLLAASALALLPLPATAADPEQVAPVAAEESAAEAQFVISGIINRAFLFWDDGEESDVYTVDNPQDSSGIAAEASFTWDGWSAGFVVALDAAYASADTVDQLDTWGDGWVIELPYLFGQFGHERLGTIIVGQSDSASDEVENVNLSESDAVADASVGDWIEEFYLRAAGVSGDDGLATGRLGAFNEGNGEVRWGDFIDGKLAGESGRFISYISPEFAGFEASVAVGQPQEIFLVHHELDEDFIDREGGVYWDAALRYAGTLGRTFTVEGAIGYWEDHTEEEAATEPTEDKGWGGSLAVRHEPTGLNLAAGYATESHTDECAEPGAVSLECRGDDEIVYVKGGIVRDVFEFGSTALYGEYHIGRKDHNDSDEDFLRTLEENEEEAEELESSEVTVWGLGVVQEIRSLHPALSTTELYVGYRHYELDLDLINAEGSVPERDIDDFDVVMAGVTIQWGGAPERECPPYCEEESGPPIGADEGGEDGADGEGEGGGEE